MSELTDAFSIGRVRICRFQEVDLTPVVRLRPKQSLTSRVTKDIVLVIYTRPLPRDPLCPNPRLLLTKQSASLYLTLAVETSDADLLVGILWHRSRVRGSALVCVTPTVGNST